MHKSLLARRYACAFLNVYGRKYTREDIQHLEQLSRYFSEHKDALFYLKLSCIKPTIKKSILLNIFAHYTIKNYFDKLLDLLIMHNRLFMIIDVLYSIIQVYKERNHVIAWDIKSAIPLDTDDLKILYQFLESKTGMNAEYTFHVDKKLVAGIRIQSATLLWEHSVSQQLKRLAQQ